jgi:hypothetical protein
MSTESPVVPETFNAQETASRHSELFKNLDTPQEPVVPVGTDLAELANKGISVAPEKKEQVKEKVDDSGIPPEMLGEEKPTEQDDWEKLHNEEVKGHLKNENWKRYKEATGKKVQSLQEERDSIKKELESVRGKLNADYVPEQVQKRLERAESLLKEREEELGKIAVERSPAFQEKFTKRQESLSGQLEKTIDELGLDKSIASQLIHSSLKKRVETLDGLELSASGQGYITSLLQQYDQVSSEKDSFLSDWQNQKAQMEQEEFARTDAEKARLKEQEDRIFNIKLEAMAKTFAPLRKVEGNDAWNAGVDEIISTAKKFYDGQFTNEEFSEIVLAGAGAKRLGVINERLIADNRKLAAENASLKAANPDVNPADGKVTAPNGKNSERFDRADAQRAFREIVSAPRHNEVA